MAAAIARAHAKREEAKERATTPLQFPVKHGDLDKWNWFERGYGDGDSKVELSQPADA
jgi:hypothetical protein